MPGTALAVVVDGLVVVVRVEPASEARGAVLLVVASAAGRVVRGLLAAVVAEGAREVREVVFPGEDLTVEADVAGVRRTVCLRVSSPDVTDDSSGSASDVVFEVRPVRLTVVPAAGRVGGLFKLDPMVLVREVDVVAGFDALSEALALLVVGRVALEMLVPGRRGGADLPADAASLAA